MNFSDLTTELSDRGFSHLSPTRLGRYINRAMHRIDGMYRWPYREDSGIGIPPLIIATLGQVEAVTNQSQSDYPLVESSYKDLTEWFGDLTTSGTPIYWYRAYVDGDPIIATYPISDTDTIGVQFWQIFADLTGTNIPAMPTRYHPLIVDMAVMMAYRDMDAHAMAEAMRPEINQQILEMMEDMLPQQDPGFQRQSAWHEDG